MAARPWSHIAILNRDDPLLPIPQQLHCLRPHPYQHLGAPYGAAASPFQLRSAVIKLLIEAQDQLQQRQPGWALAIFDAWRPLAVQRFMVAHSIAEECRSRGLDPLTATAAALAEVTAAVGRFWAPPSDNPATPPPHSTGAAVDLTLLDAAGAVVDMGSAIDVIGAVSEPDHFRQRADQEPQSLQRQQWLRFDQRRRLLQAVMEAAGFAQHPNEWWHFSYGDQLWAWRWGEPAALYGRCSDEG